MRVNLSGDVAAGDAEVGNIEPGWLVESRKGSHRFIILPEPKKPNSVLKGWLKNNNEVLAIDVANNEFALLKKTERMKFVRQIPKVELEF